MADITEVAQALVDVLAQAAYPNGTAQPSVGNCPILIYQGWPVPQQLEADLRSGKVHISVFPRPGDRVTTVMAGDGDWQEQSNDGMQGVSVREIRRQTRTFQITVWASCFERRDPVAKAIDSALASITRLSFPDGSQGVMSYANSVQDDSQQKQGIYRRDLFYAVNYATTQSETDYAIQHVQTNVSVGPTLDAQGPAKTIIT
ncbi:hypothetical protein [Pandoraea sp. CB10b_02]|uniref:hypothetical protein n=1 Tax=Pandoraea sp. CB10b_02 TaxID=2014535 RepID=UPI0025809F30|nr:hypothetical protein [Pandoraea sp. CB10b_02]